MQVQIELLEVCMIVSFLGFIIAGMFTLRWRISIAREMLVCKVIASFCLAYNPCNYYDAEMAYSYYKFGDGLSPHFLELPTYGQS